MNKHLEIKSRGTGVTIPNYAHSGDVGMDLYLFSNEGGYVLEAGARGTFSTGVMMALPDNTIGLIYDKSGIASKLGVTVLGGVIDGGYRGEIKVCLLNAGKVATVINPGQKIAQLLILPFYKPEVRVVDKLREAEDNRGEGGFGSTGV